MGITEQINTARLELRPLSMDDAPGILRIHHDEVVNRFLPWFTINDIDEARRFIAKRHDGSSLFTWTLRYKGGDQLLGHVTIALEEPYDLGYVLDRPSWGQGLMGEAVAAVTSSLDGVLPYLTATHDINNPASGGVMRKAGLTYRYSYIEHWQPKGFDVTFRLYQKDFSPGLSTYMGYWEEYPHFIESF